MPRGWVPVGAGPATSRNRDEEQDQPSDPSSPAPESEMRWSLWGDLEG